MRAFVSGLGQDVRHAVRLWCRSPALSLAILTTLTLSVGATTAVFTFVDVLLLRPLPIHSPHELHVVGTATPGAPDLNPRYFSREFYTQLTETDPAFRDLFASSVVVSSGIHLSADDVRGAGSRRAGLRQLLQGPRRVLPPRTHPLGRR